MKLLLYDPIDKAFDFTISLFDSEVFILFIFRFEIVSYVCA